MDPIEYAKKRNSRIICVSIAESDMLSQMLNETDKSYDELIGQAIRLLYESRKG